MLDDNGRPSRAGDLPLADWLVPVHYGRRDTAFRRRSLAGPASSPWMMAGSMSYLWLIRDICDGAKPCGIDIEAYITAVWGIISHTDRIDDTTTRNTRTSTCELMQVQTPDTQAAAAQLSTEVQRSRRRITASGQRVRDFRCVSWRRPPDGWLPRGRGRAGSPSRGRFPSTGGSCRLRPSSGACSPCPADAARPGDGRRR